MPSSPNTGPEKSLALPALRGTFGDWTYYSTVVPMPELAKRVAFANEIHTNRELSKLIQRSLKGGTKGGRAHDIADYLNKETERFFNSLVIALYGGTPQWVPLAVKEKAGAPNLGNGADSLGVLHLAGTEKLFAVDGQHRLAGMKHFMDTVTPATAGKASALADLVSVLFVAHRTDRIERTRRLFTTLNKTAVPVSKMERIALDENDVMAIIVRRLVEEHEWFASPRIAMHHTNNLGPDEAVALTTIGNLYDILKMLFLNQSGIKKKELEFRRPSDSELDKYFQWAVGFFEKLASVEPGLKEYFTSPDPAEVCQRYRTDEGGSVYFKPLGLALMTEVALKLKGHMPGTWLDVMKRLPRQLEQTPFSGTIWSHRATIEPKNRVLCRDLLLYMCDVPGPSAASLKARLSDVIGVPTSLPRKLRSAG